MRHSIDALVGGIDHLSAPVASSELCLALCEALAKRRGRKIEFRAISFLPGTVSGLAPNLGEQDLVLVEENTAAEHQPIITGHELCHLELGHCHMRVTEGSVAARPLRHDADPQDLVRSGLSAARRRSPALLESDGTAAKRHRKQEAEAERYGLEPAHRVHHLLADVGAEAVDRGTTPGRTAADLGSRSLRG
ncbi:toxin-antitoxin system, toxin component [Streptomyces sp. NPDC057939]|uniref:toxin-antitoxin system, toxin component n=1 Tax=Streptomyces sp. NPDC057939 TaxID=3346284 RepID=UPI0036E043FA